MKMIWCQGGNPASAKMAVEAGWWYGFRSDSNHYADELGPVGLLDSHWIEPDWQRHVRVAREVQPWLATVPDTMEIEELTRTVEQGEEIAAHCDCVLIVPKCSGLIERLPRRIGGKTVVLGYSVPTSYGGTELPLWDFIGWPVHLLGGNTTKHLELCGYLDVVSIDGNLPWLLARRGIVVTEKGTAGRTLREQDGRRWEGENAPLEALRRSLNNLRKVWGVRVKWRNAHEVSMV